MRSGEVKSSHEFPAGNVIGRRRDAFTSCATSPPARSVTSTAPPVTRSQIPPHTYPYPYSHSSSNHSLSPPFPSLFQPPLISTLHLLYPPSFSPSPSPLAPLLHRPPSPQSNAVPPPKKPRPPRRYTLVVELSAWERISMKNRSERSRPYMRTPCAGPAHGRIYPAQDQREVLLMYSRPARQPPIVAESGRRTWHSRWA